MSRAGQPPKNANASTWLAVHDAWSTLITGRTNMCREWDKTMTNAQIRCERPVRGSIQEPSRP
jgi:hypothetical protein